jgi:hypothetical protein
MLPFIYIQKRELTEKENGTLPFVFCKPKTKNEICFPWSAKDQWLLTFAVSANVSIYG